MATLLNDQELRKLLGKVIIDGDASSIRPNSYVLRLGSGGEFLNAQKQFELGKKKKGIRIQPGHSVAVTAFETLDFRRETVHQVYPEHDLHGLVSPTTDLSREGIVAATTQIDAGFQGTLNWTLTNTSSEERRFILKERIYRLSIFRLEKGEIPDKIYEGDYQGRTGYVPSQRKGAPVGMKEDEWTDSVVEGGPEQLLDNLLKSGYPWHALGQRLKIIDQQFKSVSDEYGEIRESLDRLASEVDGIRDKQTEAAQEIPKVVAQVFSDQCVGMQNRWLIGASSLLLALSGLVISVISSDAARAFLRDQGWWMGIVFLIVGIGAMLLISRRGHFARGHKD